MSLRRYFCERIRRGACDLSSAESRHAAAVMRARVGDAVELFDGRGTVADAAVIRVAPKSVSVEVTAPKPRVPPPQPCVSLHVAVPKGPRQHILIEKCTELGVGVIQPMIAARSVVKSGPSVISRWRRYAIEAGKQSRQAWIPEIQPPLVFRQTIEVERVRVEQALNLIASLDPGALPFAEALREATASSGLTHIAAWIGPEGGFTPDEMQAALAAGLQPVSLGASVLRIETAAIAVAAAVRLGRLSYDD